MGQGYPRRQYQDGVSVVGNMPIFDNNKCGDDALVPRSGMG
jgi:hypothetical protein